MTKRLVRPIRSERDRRNAAIAAKKLRRQAAKESEAERRLQALIREMERFDSENRDLDEDAGEAAREIHDLPGRRWSDDSSS
jgi:hypothetical protein